MRVFINAIFAQIFLNGYVFWRGWKILPPKYACRAPFVTVFAAELIVYVFGFVFMDEMPSEALYPSMVVGTSWTIFLLYMAGFLAAYDFSAYLAKRTKRISSVFKSLKIRRTYYLVSLLTVVLLMVYGGYNFWHPEVRSLNLAVTKASKINRLKIVLVADIHAGNMVNGDILKMYIDKIMEQKPDLILLAGDIIDYDIRPLDEQQMDKQFRRLEAPYGVFASTGNHEYRLDGEAKIRWLKDKAGLTVLRDSVVKVNDAFYIIGREDDKAPVRKSLRELMKGIDKSYPIIVMNHEPRRLQEEANEQVDMAFYGHTHGGQIFPYTVFINLLYEVGHGYKQKGDTHVFVTSGLGLSGPQYRIGSSSEIAVITAYFAGRTAGE
jgi:predicted MPP superfamily phosphohydrolase